MDIIIRIDSKNKFNKIWLKLNILQDDIKTD